MANAINIPKTHLIMGLSLPLAVLLGYFVAEPMELGSLAVVVFVLVVLSIPLLMKWYYPLLVFGWNTAICAVFLPGHAHFWTMMAFIGLLFAVVSRAVSPNARFVIEPSVTMSLLVLTAVVVGTAMITGGFGAFTMGSERYGGRSYFYFLAAVAGYFVLTSRRIPPHRARFYVALFFLSALTYGASVLVVLNGARFDFLRLVFPPTTSSTFDGPVMAAGAFLRVTELAAIALALFSYLLARFGIRGLLDLTRPWRLLLLFLAVAAALLSGFRGLLVFCALTFAVVFYLEGLHRTRYVPALLGVLLLGGLVVLPQAEKLPLAAQRALSFLPGKFNWAAQHSASSTVDWRVGMWKDLLPEVSKHLFRGKGWGFDAVDFRATVELGEGIDPLASTKLVGDYHNGPLSVLIPFGLYGMIAFLWFLAAGLRVLHRNWKFGDPALRTANTLLLASFAVHIFAFFIIFGSLYSDMAIFTGLLGLSVALNGAGVAPALAEQPAAGVEFNTEYVKA